MSYESHVVLDFEFNPVNPEYRYRLKDEIIEIGAVKLNPQMEIIGKFSCLVKPQWSDFVSPKITELTGIRTEDVKNAVCFPDALQSFSRWVGESRTKVYSWSENDFRQILWECYAKEIFLPDNLNRWTDLQKVFQRVVHHPHNRCLALHDAVRMMGEEYSSEQAHRALYDAELTAELLRTIKSEEFKYSHGQALRTYLVEDTHSTFSLGSACSDALAALMKQLSVA